MVANLNEIYQAIGSLTTEVKALRRDIEDGKRDAKDGADKADAQRAVMHRRLDELVGDVGDVKTDIEGLKADVTDAKSVTDDVKRWKLMGMGALGVTGLAAAAVSSLVTYKWTSVVNWFAGK